ncbi:unnamed protein product [Didymodactylos carnosus]|nr:unnamed protein product [Didymodactylos carnosus]CAF3712686.1 unnamed protein product [Didymodactylos carnosus]
MLIGGFILMIISFNKIGGISNLYRQYLLAVPSYTNSTIPSYTSVFSNQTTTGICGKPSVKSFQMLRSYKDPDMPWLGFFLGHTPNTIWYWCSDQMMVQRVLAAKTLSHARGGTLLAGYLKILPLFMIILPGMISRSLFPNTVGCNQPSVCEKLCNSKRSCTNIAYPALILNVLPDGLKGIMLAVMLAALISGLTSIFNSASTLFTIDIYPNLLFRRKDKITNRELMIVGRLFVILMTVFGIAWIPIVIEMQGSELYIYMQQVIGFLAPPIACIYILAILWKRANEVGAFSGLMVGFAFGLLRMILEFSHIPPLCGQVDRRLLFIRKINFMYYAIFLFWLTLITCVIVSLCTKPPTKEQLFRTTYWTRKQKSMNRDLVVIELPDTVSDVAAILNQPTYEKTSFEYDSHNSTYQSYPVCEQLQPDALLNSKPDQTDQKYLDTGSITRICTARTSVTNMDEISSSSKNIIKIPRGNRRDDSCMAFKYLKQFGSWFCGLEEEKQTAIVNEEKENSLNEQNQTEQPTETRLIMLKQRSHIKWILNINLLILILIEILLFVLFSLPAKYTFLRNN